MKKLKKIFIVTLILSLLVSCVPKGESDSGSDSSEKQLIVGSEQMTSSIDPVKEWDGWFPVRYGITETLFKLSDKLEIEPWLAEKYENIDPLTWKITLKDNLKFSNGKEVTTEDVVENLKRIGQENDRALSLKDAEFTVENNEITIKTKEPFATIINDLADPYASIVNLKDSTDLVLAPIGTGPFKVEKFTPEVSIELLKNENYWDGEVKLDKATVKKIGDKETISLALQSGEIDAAFDLGAQALDLFKDESKYTINSIPTSRVYSMFYNLENIPDLNVRKAISAAINKKSITENLLNNMATETKGPFPDYTPYGENNLKNVGYNVEEAKKFLEASGYTDSDGDGILEKDGQKLTINVVLYKRAYQEEIATEIQSELKAIGIDAQVTKHEKHEYLKAGAFDLGFYYVVTTPTGGSEVYLRSISKSTGESNFGKYSKAEVDQILEEMAKEFDPGKRTELSLKIQQQILDDKVVEYIAFNNLSVVTKAGVKNMVPHPTDCYQLTKDVDKE